MLRTLSFPRDSNPESPVKLQLYLTYYINIYLTSHKLILFVLHLFTMLNSFSS